jgi:hypothetical protein
LQSFLASSTENRLLQRQRRAAEVAEQVGDHGPHVHRTGFADARFGQKVGRALREAAGEGFEERAFVMHVCKCVSV